MNYKQLEPQMQFSDNLLNELFGRKCMKTLIPYNMYVRLLYCFLIMSLSQGQALIIIDHKVSNPKRLPWCDTWKKVVFCTSVANFVELSGGYLRDKIPVKWLLPNHPPTKWLNQPTSLPPNPKIVWKTLQTVSQKLEPTYHLTVQCSRTKKLIEITDLR